MIPIGVDLGYHAVKCAAADGRRRCTFPSVVGSPERGRFSISDNGSGPDAIILTLPGGRLCQVGDSAILQSRFLDRREDRAWIQSETYLALLQAAFSEMTAATVVEAFVVSGLPVAFYGDKGLLRERLLGEHRIERAGRRAQLVRVIDARVIPQPFGALLSSALDDAGRISDQALAAGAVGVIDCGGKTTNLLSVNRLAEIGHETASVTLGAWDVARSVGDWLDEHCPGLELRDHRLMEAIVSRRSTHYGQPVDLGPAVDAALAPLADQVLAQAGQLWNGGAALEAILVTGGGALLLGPRILSRFRHARIVDDPVFANAIGYWKFARRLLAAG